MITKLHVIQCKWNNYFVCSLKFISLFFLVCSIIFILFLFLIMTHTFLIIIYILLFFFIIYIFVPLFYIIPLYTFFLIFPPLMCNFSHRQYLLILVLFCNVHIGNKDIKVNIFYTSIRILNIE